MEKLNDLLFYFDSNIGETGSNSDKRSAQDTKLPIKVAYINQNTIPRFTDHNYIGKFGINERKEYIEQPEDTCYIHLPAQIRNFKIDLNRGFHKSTLFRSSMDGYKEYRNLKREYFFKWISDNNYLNQSKPLPKFISIAGNIASILITPFEQHEDWVLHATKYKGHIFMDKVRAPSPDARDRRKDITNDYYLGFHGNKFVHLITSEKRVEEKPMSSKLDDEIDNNKKRFDLFEAKFGFHQLLMVCEIDAIDPGSANRVEIKLYKELKDLNDHAWLREYKYLQWWSKCAVCSVPDLVYGLREIKFNKSRGRHSDEDPVTGTLKEIISIKSRSIEDECQPFWSSTICYNFLDRVFNFIMEKVVDDNPRSVYEISWFINNDKITSKKLSNSPLLPEWFIDKTMNEAKVA